MQLLHVIKQKKNIPPNHFSLISTKKQKRKQLKSCGSVTSESSYHKEKINS